MIGGTFRDGHPRVLLTLPGINGSFDVECIIDTGFEGDLALPSSLARQLGPVPDGFSERLLADGSLYRCPFYLLPIEDDEGTREVEVLVLGLRPLMGTMFLYDHLLQVEMRDGGEVTIEPL